MRTPLYGTLVERWPALRRLARPARFGAVGVGGLVLNTLLLWLLVSVARLPAAAASALATEAAILQNFLLNDRWTFRGASAGGRGFGARLLQFNGVALGGMAITVGVLTALVSYAGVPLLLANVAAVGAATVWNYVVNSRWTWSRPPEE